MKLKWSGNILERNFYYIIPAMKTGLPVKAGWRNASIKYFLKKMDEGAEDTGAVWMGWKI